MSQDRPWRCDDVGLSRDNNTFPGGEYFNSSELKIADATIRDWDVNEGLTVVAPHDPSLKDLPIQVISGWPCLSKRWGCNLADYLNRFKFGVPTCFGLADEYTGQLPADNIINITMSSFGQGISVTQTMLRAFTAIANDRVMLEPNLSAYLYSQMTSLFVSL